MTQDAKLVALLMETFSGNDALRGFLRQHIGQSFVDDLPSPEVAKSRYFDLAAERLVGHRALTPTLVDAWAASVPERACEIRALVAPESTEP